MATPEEWAHGYARQADLDFEVFQAIQGPHVKECHRLLFLLYFPRLAVLSCGQAEQPLGGGLNFLLGDPRA